MSQILSLVGWTFLPGLATGWLQSLYYGVTIRAGDPRPQPGQPRFVEHRRRIQIAVVTVYLLYTLYEADYDVRRAGSFYADLGLGSSSSSFSSSSPTTISARDIKARFRRLAALYHPDKVSSATANNVEQVNAFFVHLKTAADTLMDPAKRFAYDRFGPDTVAWSTLPKNRCVLVADFVFRGLQTSVVPFYVGAAVSLAVLSLVGYFGNAGRGFAYVRWLVLALALVFELYAVTRPYAPSLLTDWVNPLLAVVVPLHPPLLPFQAVTLARRASLTIFMGLSQIGPLLSSDDPSPGGNDKDALEQTLGRLDAVVAALDTDAQRLLEMEMAPFAGDPAQLRTVQARVKEWLVQNTIRNDPMVRDAIGQSLHRRREAPHGARGTK